MADTEPYSPGDYIYSFMKRFCDKCAHDQSYRDHGGDSCLILMRGTGWQIGDPEYPPEWVCDAGTGENPRCTALEPTTAAATGAA